MSTVKLKEEIEHTQGDIITEKILPQGVLRVKSSTEYSE